MKRDSTITISVYNGMSEGAAICFADQMVRDFTADEASCSNPSYRVWFAGEVEIAQGRIERTPAGNLAIHISEI